MITNGLMWYRTVAIGWEHRPRGCRRRWVKAPRRRAATLARILTVVAGIVAGLAAFGIGEGTAELIPPETVQFSVFGQARGMATRDTPRVVKRTAALAFGVLGFCLGGCLGIAGGVARRRAAAPVAGVLVGASCSARAPAKATLACSCRHSSRCGTTIRIST